MFLNIHFESKKLASSLQKTRSTGMLHFVYNSSVAAAEQVVGCLVNHSYREGLFVLQVPLPKEPLEAEALLDRQSAAQVLACLHPSLSVSPADIE